MALSSPGIRELCTAKEWALIQASQPGNIEKLSSTELKKHAANAQKLVSKWQDLARSQDRTESRKSGSPNLGSRSHEKHDAFKTALVAFQARLTTAPSTGSPAKGKPNSKARSIEARSTRRATRKTLEGSKIAINRAAKPAPVAKPAAVTKNPTSNPGTGAKPATKKTAKKAPAKKTAAVKASTKLAAQRKKRAATIAANAAATPQPKAAKAPKAIKAKGTPAKQAALSGKVNATRNAIAVRTNKIAGHVSGKGKRVQGKRDARGR